MIVTACGFEHGAPARRDAPPAIDDADIDAPDAAPNMIDAMVDAQPPNPVTCNPTGLPCVGTATAIACNGGCWVKCVSAGPITNQFAAATACTTWGGKLAPLKSTSDHTCAVMTIFSGQAFWIGLEQASTATQVDTQWTWNSDGVAITFDAWGMGQPNDLNGNENDHAEQCAFINTDGDWHDEACTNGGLYRFLCRR